MNSQPLVSVIVPVYDRREYIREALASAFAQSYKNLEVIVVDDGSSVDIADCLRGCAGKIKYFTQPHSGPSAARNTGAKNASGKYLAFLDDDDLFEPGKLEDQVRLMEAHPDAGFCYSAYYCFLPDKKKTVVIPKAQAFPAERFAEIYFLHTDITMPSLLLRKDRFISAGLFDEKIVYNEDADLWLRLAARYPVIYSPRPSAGVRIHSARLSYRNPLMLQGLIGVLESALRRQPELGKVLGREADKKIAYLTYLLGWAYLVKNEKACALAAFKAYRDSKHGRHSRLWMNALLFIAERVKPAVLAAGYAKLIGIKNKLHGT